MLDKLSIFKEKLKQARKSVDDEEDPGNHEPSEDATNW